jgi:hypothetical protein
MFIPEESNSGTICFLYERISNIMPNFTASLQVIFAFHSIPQHLAKSDAQEN